MHIAYDVSTAMDSNIKLDLAENWSEKELKNIIGYKTIVGKLSDAARDTGADISFPVAALSRYNSCPVTSHPTTAKESFRISNPQESFDCTQAAAAAPMIKSLATRTPIWPLILQNANQIEVMYAFSATELSHCSQKNKISSRCQLSNRNTSPARMAYIIRNCCSSSTEIYTAKIHHCSRSNSTIRAHLVTSELESQKLAPSISRFPITIVKTSMLAIAFNVPTSI